MNTKQENATKQARRASPAKNIRPSDNTVIEKPN
jgi:hypothetical protein